MHQHSNDLGQTVGAPVPGWAPARAPARTPMTGRLCTVEPIDPARHAADLFAAFRADAENRIWTYLPYGPFESRGAFEAWMREACLGDDPLSHAVVDAATGRALGMASYLRIDPAAGAIEVGHITYAPVLQRTAAATEAMYLMMRRVFAELGYRRYEWKCDAFNAASRHAARRLGFTYEGTFRQAMVYKGRNRDTAWFSIIDREWPALDRAFTAWLDPANFDAEGRHTARLAELIARERGE